MKKQFLLLLFCSLFTVGMYGQTYPVTSIINNGIDLKRINYVILGDGYQSSEMTTFIGDATSIANDLFNASPFKEYKNFFNVYAIEVPSNESGADHPGTATDVSEPVFAVASVDNAFGSTFDAFGIHRLLVPMNSQAVVNVLSSNYPNYDQVMVVVNSPHYGGSGGWLATSSTNTSASEIAIHEIGHSFSALADEYWAGDVYAGEKPNMTANSNASTVKWKDWVGLNGVGVYAYGSSGNQANWFRPHQNCKMRYLGVDFCSVCTEATIDKIYSLVTPIEDFSPLTTTIDYSGTPLNFNLSLVYPTPNTLTVEWELNGNVAGSTAQLTVSEAQLTQGSNTLVARVTDNTVLSKSYLPASGYIFTQIWTITNNSTSINEVAGQNGIGKFFYKAFPNPVKDDLTVQYFYNGTSTEATVNILTLEGKNVKSQVQNLLHGNHQWRVPMADLAAGVYLIQINADAVKASFKVVKQ